MAGADSPFQNSWTSASRTMCSRTLPAPAIRTSLYAGKEGTETFDGAWVTPNSFELLGVKPLLGRAIACDDGKPGAAPVFVMSYRLWTKQFNRDPKIVGTTMVLNDQPRTLVGIMPPRFLWEDSDIWMPIYWTHSDIPGVLGPSAHLPLCPGPPQARRQFASRCRGFERRCTWPFQGLFKGLPAALRCDYEDPHG